METEQELFKQAGVAAMFAKTEKVFRFPNGSLIQAGHMDDIEAVERYLSTEYDIIVPDEGSQYPVDTDGHAPVIALSTRARTTKPQVLASPIGRGKFWLVSNPGGPSASAILDFFIDKTPDFDRYPQLREKYHPEDWAYIAAYLDDNPYLAPEYEADLAVNSRWRYEQLRYGNWRVFAGQFFSEWDDKVHVRTLAA
jgi:phage terminase large subunit